MPCDQGDITMNVKTWLTRIQSSLFILKSPINVYPVLI